MKHVKVIWKLEIFTEDIKRWRKKKSDIQSTRKDYKGICINSVIGYGNSVSEGKREYTRLLLPEP